MAISSAELDYITACPILSDGEKRWNEIKDLVIDSPEYKAGLRNGMGVLDDNLVFNTEMKTRFVVVQTNKGPIKIEFIPTSRIMNIPQIT